MKGRCVLSKEKKWANEWNFHASVNLANSKYCRRFFVHFSFLCVLHRLNILWGLDVNFVWCSRFLLWEFCVVVWYRLLCVPADTCLNFEVPNEHVEHFEGVCVAFEINRGAYYTFFRRERCSTEWALHIYCLQFPLFDRFGKWESVRVLYV